MADDKTSVDSQNDDSLSDDSNGVEVRLSKLEKVLSDTMKALDEERKASAGKDKKITTLAEERKKLMEAAGSKDKLLEIREKELEERAAEEEKKFAERNAELARLQNELDKRRVLDKIENFPSFMFDRVKGNTPEEIEADARSLMKQWVKERDKRENAQKVGKTPQTGEKPGGAGKTYSADDFKEMSPKQQRETFMKMSPEERNKVFDEFYGGQKE